MEPVTLLALAVISLFTRWQKRFWILLFFSISVLFVLQPTVPIRFLSQLFPILSLGFVIVTWGIIRQPSERFRSVAGVWILCMVGMLVALKIPDVAIFLSSSLRTVTQQRSIDASLADWQWIGISYIVLRLIAILQDYRQGRLGSYTLGEMLIFTLFPASILAGPIDRLQRFAPEILTPNQALIPSLVDGGQRIVVGMFKKFVIADSLALVTLSPQLAGDTQIWWSAWIITYVYALQIFFDFSGYSDMAIGLGKIAGFELPENFNRPYLRQNLSLFWQNWHMSLTGWFRSYVFLPLTRSLLRRKLPISDFLLGQVVTMSLIAAWHGITVNFMIWGLWHAVGLYLHRQIATRTRTWYLRQSQRVWARRVIYALGVLTTFHYVAIGWVFFALPDPATSIEHLKVMFGL